jgi:hypothetical protein
METTTIPSTTTTATVVTRSTTSMPTSGSVVARRESISQASANVPPTMPRTVATAPIRKLSVTAMRSAVRTRTPKANIVAWSRDRASAPMLAVRKAISSAMNSTTAAIIWKIPVNTWNCSRTTWVDAVTDSAAVTASMENSSRWTSPGAAPLAGRTWTRFAAPSRPKVDAAESSM